MRVVVVDGEPWFVAADVARELGYRMASDLTRTLDPDERGTHQTRTPSGDQSISVISEGGLFRALVQRQTGRITDDEMREKVKTFQRIVTHEILPAIRKTGSYSVVEKSPMDIIRDQHQAVAMLLEENESLTVRAVQAESTVETIEGGDGLSVRQFHKQYFSETSEHEFNDLLYRKRLLIDQRGTRGRDSRGRLKNGKEHRHPTFIGKPFFYLEPTIDRETGDRYYQTKVRPGTPEVELIHYLEKQGLEANRNIGRALSAVNS